MTYDEKDLRIVEGIGFIQKHPDRFLPYGVVDADHVACCLVLEVLVKNERPATVFRIDEWRCVASTEDWMNGETAEQMKQHFFQARPFPEAGVNSLHSEVLIGAFAKDICVVGPSGRNVVAGDHPPEELIAKIAEMAPGFARAVLFRLGETAAQASN